MFDYKRHSKCSRGGMSFLFFCLLARVARLYWQVFEEKSLHVMSHVIKK